MAGSKRARETRRDQVPAPTPPGSPEVAPASRRFKVQMVKLPELTCNGHTLTAGRGWVRTGEVS